MLADDLPITGPCPINLDEIGFDWNAKTAFCSHCTKHVTNLSSMTSRESAQFLAANEGQDLCVSYRAAAGKIVHRPEPLIPAQRLRRRSLATSAGLSVALAACAPHAPPPVPDATEIREQDDTRDVTIPEMPPSPQSEEAIEPCDSEVTERRVVGEAPIVTERRYAGLKPKIDTARRPVAGRLGRHVQRDAAQKAAQKPGG